jgi:hypothetical protein
MSVLALGFLRAGTQHRLRPIPARSPQFLIPRMARDLSSIALALRTWRHAHDAKLEQLTREDLGFGYLAGQTTPDHKTLSDRPQRAAITAMCTEVLLFSRRAGMARRATVAIDSTRLQRIVAAGLTAAPGIRWSELPQGSCTTNRDPQRTPLF